MMLNGCSGAIATSVGAAPAGPIQPAKGAPLRCRPAQCAGSSRRRRPVRPPRRSRRRGRPLWRRCPRASSSSSPASTRAIAARPRRLQRARRERQLRNGPRSARRWRRRRHGQRRPAAARRRCGRPALRARRRSASRRLRSARDHRAVPSRGRGSDPAGRRSPAPEAPPPSCRAPRRRSAEFVVYGNGWQVPSDRSVPSNRSNGGALARRLAPRGSGRNDPTTAC